jgi:hypothetical protein
MGTGLDKITGLNAIFTMFDGADVLAHLLKYRQPSGVWYEEYVRKADQATSQSNTFFCDAISPISDSCHVASLAYPMFVRDVFSNTYCLYQRP